MEFVTLKLDELTRSDKILKCGCFSRRYILICKIIADRQIMLQGSIIQDLHQEASRSLDGRGALAVGHGVGWGLESGFPGANRSLQLSVTSTPGGTA